MTAGDFLFNQAVVRALDFIARDPENNLEKLISIGERLALNPDHKDIVAAVKRVLSEDTIWKDYTVKLLQNTTPRVRNRLGVNFFVNAFFKGVPKQFQLRDELGFSVPFALLIDPTSACNLNCTGCWASDYSRTENLDVDLLERILDEARELGIYFILYSGGEPLIRKKDLLYLAEKFDDMAFLAFTNGTLVDDAFADALADVGNFTLAFSLEGFAESTDRRRGQGVFDKIMKGMDRLSRRGVIFGASTTYNRQNTEEVGSNAYMDMLVEKGCAYNWYFTYIPIGQDFDLDLMATPAQRAFMYHQVRYFRQTKPIFNLDFWNDGKPIEGCIAGGRRYLHINAAGDVEPCAFIHYATDNIKNKSLRQVLESPLFAAYQRRMPFNDNHLRPCPLIDNPETLPEMVLESGAYSTQEKCQHEPEQLAKALGQYAREWGDIAEKLKRSHELPLELAQSL